MLRARRVEYWSRPCEGWLRRALHGRRRSGFTEFAGLGVGAAGLGSPNSPVWNRGKGGESLDRTKKSLPAKLIRQMSLLCRPGRTGRRPYAAAQAHSTALEPPNPPPPHARLHRRSASQKWRENCGTGEKVPPCDADRAKIPPSRTRRRRPDRERVQRVTRSAQLKAHGTQRATRYPQPTPRNAPDRPGRGRSVGK